MTYKSFGKKDMQDTTQMKWTVGPIVPPYEKQIKNNQQVMTSVQPTSKPVSNQQRLEVDGK